MPPRDDVRLPDGRRAQLWEGGATDGAVVVFFHGCPDCRLAAVSGSEAARELGVRIIAVNRPGYGRSDPHRSGLASVADDTVAVADRLGVARFAVLGMSVGGAYALACAAHHPGRVTAAGVVAGPAVVPELDPPAHRDGLSEADQESLRVLAATTADAAVELMRPQFAQYVAALAPDDPDDAALVARLTEPMDPADAAVLTARPVAEVARSTREALAQPDGYLRDAAVTFRPWEVRPEQVGCPTWLWYGELDRSASPRNGRWLADHVPGAKLVVRPGTGHLAALTEHWPEILQTLRDAAG